MTDTPHKRGRSCLCFGHIVPQTYVIVVVGWQSALTALPRFSLPSLRTAVDDAHGRARHLFRSPCDPSSATPDTAAAGVTIGRHGISAHVDTPENLAAKIPTLLGVAQTMASTA